MVERALATFVVGAASAVSVEYLAAASSNADLRGLQAAGLAALSCGIAAVLSLRQHLPGAGTRAGAVVPAHPFPFRISDGTDLTGGTIGEFVRLASGVSDATWADHLHAHDFSTWIGSSLGNPALAGALRTIEDSGDTVASTRLRVISALQAAYGPAAPLSGGHA